MIDRFLLPFQHVVLAIPAHWLAAQGLRADQITLAGFIIGALALPLLAFEHTMLALVCILLNRLCDGLDGMVARLTRPTDRGAFLDIALDFLFYALVPLGFALGHPANALPAAILIASFIGTGSSFLALAIFAQKRGISAYAYPSKGLYYISGLTEGFETIAFFIAMCLWPQHFAPLAYAFAALCFITTMGRWIQGYKLLS